MEVLKEVYQNTLEITKELESSVKKLEGLPEDRKDFYIQKLTQIKHRMESNDEKSKPIVAVYGIYNAGKSSLINALAGEEICEVGDIPTTTYTKEVHWNGYLFYDTPGIDSPRREDEERAKKSIEEADVVIFVISDGAGSFEYGKVYTEIKEIVEKSKHLIVVINEKGYYDNSEEKQKILMKIKRNIRKILGECKVSIYNLNARLALLGKQKNNEIAIQKSNILILEREIITILKEDMVLVRSVYGQLVELVKEIKKDFSVESFKKMDDVYKEKLEKIYKEIKEIKLETEEKLCKYIEDKLPRVVVDPFLHELKVMGLKGIEDGTGVELEKLYEVLGKKIDGFENIFLQEAVISLKQAYDTFKYKMRDVFSDDLMGINFDVFKKSLADRVENLQAKIGIIDRIVKCDHVAKPEFSTGEIIEILGENFLKSELGKIILKKLPDIVRKEVVNYLPELAVKELIVTGLSKMLPATLTKTIVKDSVVSWIPIAGQIWIVLDFVLSIFTSYKEKQIEKELEYKRKLEEAKDNAREEMENSIPMIREQLLVELVSHFKYGAREIIDNYFQEIESCIQGISQADRQNIVKLSELENRLMEVVGN